MTDEELKECRLHFKEARDGDWDRLRWDEEWGTKLMDEIERLKKENSRLEMEANQMFRAITVVEENGKLKDENARLKKELGRAEDVLDQAMGLAEKIVAL